MDKSNAVFPDFSEELKKVFQDRKHSILDYVNMKMQKHPDMGNLIGGEKNITAMLDNHRNHLSFIGIVIQLEDAEMILKTLPWVYRSYHSQGFSYDYFLSVLEFWKEAINTSLTDIDCTPILQIYDSMISRHEDTISESQKPLPGRASLLQSQLQKDFLDALVTGKQHRVYSITEEYISLPRTLDEYYIELVQPVMYEIGKKWEKGEISAAHEHLASAIIARILASFYKYVDVPEPSRGKILISSAANEYHEIGAWMTANIFEINGWDVHYLGANTPANDLISILRTFHPDIIGLSVTMAFNLESVITITDRIKADDELKDIKIILGGNVFYQFPKLRDLIKADYIAFNFNDALEKADTFLPAESD
jgi:MerR family transcriptional regulator, light-induced transcriptional regulator